VTGSDDFDAAVERYHEADRAIVRGDAEPYMEIYSHRDDVTLANPWGGVSRGWAQVADTLVRAAAMFREGEFAGNERMATFVTSDLAYIVELQRFSAKVGGQPEMVAVALRTTSVLRQEDGAWKVVHRHADPRIGPQSPESLLQG
jgi:ketosteroid isomerase-like protein